MSQRDLESYGPIVDSFLGRRVYVSVVVNTLKLILDRREAGAEFLWIDPAWQLLRGDELQVSSDSYPFDHEASDYANRFKAWAALASPLNEATLEHFVRRSDGGVEFLFSGGFRLVVPHSAEASGEESWYAPVPPAAQPRRLKNCTARSCFSAAARDANVPRLRRRPVFGSFFLE